MRGMGTEPGYRGLNGGQKNLSFAPIRPGDVITSVATLVDAYEKDGRLGTMMFLVDESRWTNQARRPRPHRHPHVDLLLTSRCVSQPLYRRAEIRTSPEGVGVGVGADDGRDERGGEQHAADAGGADLLAEAGEVLVPHVGSGRSR